MPIYHLPAKSAIVEAIAAGTIMAVHERLTALAITGGYVVGEGGIAIHADGSVTIDADRDPTADWLAWDPETPTPVEQERATRQEQAVAALATLKTNLEFLNAPSTGNLTAAQVKTGFRDLTRIMIGVVEVLQDTGIVDSAD